MQTRERNCGSASVVHHHGLPFSLPYAMLKSFNLCSLPGDNSAVLDLLVEEAVAEEDPLLDHPTGHRLLRKLMSLPAQGSWCPHRKLSGKSLDIAAHICPL
jgi:hypothetical protein